MWVVTRQRLKAFWEHHTDAETRLRAWYRTVQASEWHTFADVRRTFGSADVVGAFVVFNVGGNNYRVICRIQYTTHKVFIRHVLTHAEYDTNAWKRDPWF